MSYVGQIQSQFYNLLRRHYHILVKKYLPWKNRHLLLWAQLPHRIKVHSIGPPTNFV